MFCVLSGSGTLRHADEEHPISARNFVVFARRENAVDYWDGEVDEED